MQFIAFLVIGTAFVVGAGIFKLAWEAKFAGTGKVWYSKMFYAGLIGTTLTMILGFVHAKLSVRWMGENDFSALLYIRQIDTIAIALALASLVCFAIWALDKILDFILPPGR